MPASKLAFARTMSSGGMQRKVREAFKIASMGMDVVLVNGLHPERIAAAARGRMDGTVVRGRK